MGKALYALLGDSGGHLARGLTVAGLLKEHEFLFLGGGRALEARNWGYPTEEIPLLGTYYKNNRVDLFKTISKGVGLTLGGGSIIQRIRQVIRDFDPDIVITDYERFTPLAAKQLGRKCYSLDNQHVLTHCHYVKPPYSAINRAMTTASVKWVFSGAAHYLITTFFPADPIDSTITEVFPPIIRPDLHHFQARSLDHALVYQTSPTFESLFEPLKAMDEKFIIYGFGKRPEDGNLQFKAPSNEGFLEDLASCKYCIVNGGHNVISEALFFNKPVFCFPIQNAYEQLVNAHYLKVLNYGEYFYGKDPGQADIQGFARNLEHYADVISQGVFDGNELISKRINHIIEGSS